MTDDIEIKLRFNKLCEIYIGRHNPLFSIQRARHQFAQRTDNTATPANGYLGETLRHS